MEKLRKIACKAIDDNIEGLKTLSDNIWRNPELGFQEVYAHRILTDYLEMHKFSVTRSYCLDTAFRAEFGSETGPNIAVLCEYDALPDIGHACGHNLIAELGVAAGIGIKAALKQALDDELFQGKVTVLGTPAEEESGGKINLLEFGAFNNIDAAMMAHPSRKSISRPPCLSIKSVRVEFHGKASHASGTPWEGINALDAAVSAYQMVSNFRQQMKPTWKVHGIITKGGVKPNIIPDLTELQFYVRTPGVAELDDLYERVTDCCKAAALSTGCEVKFCYLEEPFLALNSNETLATMYEMYAKEVDLYVDKDDSVLNESAGSTDMGNVSQFLPSIHPFFPLGTNSSTHSKDFQIIAGKAESQKYVIKVAKILAMVALDLMSDAKCLARAKADFEESKNAGENKS